MSDLVDPTDAYEHDDQRLRRPRPPRTWRDRVDDLAAGERVPGRVVSALVALVVMGVLAWRLLAPSAPPPEVEIPFAEPAGAASEGAAGPAGEAAPSAPGAGVAGIGSDAAAVPGPAGADGGTEDASGAAGGVVVHVVGAVAAPGVQRLPAGARVVDAVDAAGGASADADLARINLAAALVDGQQVYVLRIGEVAPPPAAGANGGDAGPPAGGDTAAGDAAGGLVDINRASATELDELPGVGPTTAEAIIAHREQNGPFASVDDLIDVRGIGEAKLEQLRPHATV